MKKHIRILALVLALVLALALTACGGSTSGEEPYDDGKDVKTPEQAAAEMMGKPFNNSFDMCVVIDGKIYPVRVDSASVLSALGENCEKTETISCVYDGYDKTFEYDGIIVSTVPVDGKDVIEMFTITGPEYKTTRNITVGATREEVIAAYGENYWDDGYVNYTESGDPENISEMRIQFLFDGDTVDEIYIYSPSYSN